MTQKTLQGPGFSARLVRSARRRTLAISVRAGEVTVRAPLAVEDARIGQFLQAKAAWIRKHLDRQQQLPKAPVLASGAILHYLGQPLALTVAHGTPALTLTGTELRLCLPNPNPQEATVKAALAEWYCAQAITYLPPRVAEFAAQLGVKPRGLKVRFYKSRWGSCNRRAELQFNWLIMMAPPEVIDYVVVHELSHLRHFNHSPAFWRTVASVMPDHERQRQWLSQQNWLVW